MSRRQDKQVYYNKIMRGNHKDSRYRDESSSESPETVHLDYRKVRIVKKNLVNAAGIPQSLADEEMLVSNEFFGRYGNVQKIILKKGYVYAGKSSKTLTYNAYITYQSELEASLAVVALDDYRVGDRCLKVSYGTTKYCSHFTKDQDCPNIKECLYLHEWDTKNQIIVSEDNSKIFYSQQMRVALDFVSNNLQRILKLKKQIQIVNEFPGIQDAINNLVQRGILTADQLAKCRKNIMAASECDNPQPQNKSVKSKSQSQSTLWTPQKPVEPVLQRNGSVQKMLEMNVCKRILKQGSHSQSRFTFANGGNHDHQAQAIKKYVQHHILMNRRHLL